MREIKAMENEFQREIENQRLLQAFDKDGLRCLC